MFKYFHIAWKYCQTASLATWSTDNHTTTIPIVSLNHTSSLALFLVPELKGKQLHPPESCRQQSGWTRLTWVFVGYLVFGCVHRKLDQVKSVSQNGYGLWSVQWQPNWDPTEISEVNLCWPQMGSCYRAMEILFSAVKMKLIIAFELIIQVNVKGTIQEDSHSLFCDSNTRITTIILSDFSYCLNPCPQMLQLFLPFSQDGFECLICTPLVVQWNMVW